MFEYSFLVKKSIFFFHFLFSPTNILRISLMRNSNTQVIWNNGTTINLWVKAVFVQRLRPMKKAVARTLTMVLRIHMETLVLTTFRILIGVEITTPKRSRQTKCVVRAEVAIRTLTQRTLINRKPQTLTSVAMHAVKTRNLRCNIILWITQMIIVCLRLRIYKVRISFRVKQS